jgi:hypothetical protein
MRNGEAIYLIMGGKLRWAVKIDEIRANVGQVVVNGGKTLLVLD